MTSLAEQLRRLALPESKVAEVWDKKIPSLLFDHGVAATFDRDTFYGLGLNGLEELCLLDARFREYFYEDLFSPKAKDTERTTQSKEINQQLNHSIQHFLIRVSPYFLLKPATKCIEWLIYRFHIHTFNVDDLMLCALPYHSTNLFVRTIQLLDISHPTNKWCWLAQAKKDGVSLSNRNIAAHCTRDPGFLHFVCSMVSKALKVNRENKGSSVDIFLNFFVTTIMGVLQGPTISETLLSKLMPALTEGLKSDILDHQASSILILCQLSVKVNLEKKILANIIRIGLKDVLPKLEKDFMSAILLLSQNQEKFQFLSKKRSFVQTVVENYKSGRIENILRIILKHLLIHEITTLGVSLKKLEADQAFLGFPFFFFTNTVIISLPIFRLLVENFSDLDEGSKRFVGLREILGRLQRKYPISFDHVISDHFKRDDLDGSSSKHLLSVFGASAKHQLVPDSNVSVAIGLLHPEDAVRSRSIHHLSDALIDPPTQDMVIFATENVLRILKMDSCADVVNAALKVGRIDVILLTVVQPVSSIFLVKVHHVYLCYYWSETAKCAAKVLTTLSPHHYVDTAESEHENNIFMNSTVTVLHVLIMSLAETEWATLAKEILATGFCKNNLVLKGITQTTLTKGKAGIDFSQNEPRILAIVADSLAQNSEFLMDLASKCSASDFSCNAVMQLFQGNENDTIFSLHFNVLGNLIESLVTVKKDSPITTFTELASSNKNPETLNFERPIRRNSVLNSTFLTLLNMSQKARVYFEDRSLKSELTNSIHHLLRFLPNFLCSEFHGTPEQPPAHCLQVLNILKVMLNSWSNGSNNKVNAITICDIIYISYTKRLLMEIIVISFPSLPLIFLTLDPSDPIVPCLLLLLSSSHQSIRSASMLCIQEIAVIKPSPVVNLMVNLTKHAQELVSDPVYILQCCANYFNLAAKPSGNLINYPAFRIQRFIGFIIIIIIFMYNNNNFLETLYSRHGQSMVNATHFDSLLPLVNCFVEQSKERCLANHERIFTLECLKKLSPDALAVTAKRELFFNALSGKVEDRNTFPPQNVVFGLLTKSFFIALDDETRHDIVSTLLGIGATTQNPDVAKLVFKTFKVIPLRSTSITAELKKYEKSSATDTVAPSSVVAAKRARLSKSTSSEADDIETPSWKRLIVLLEVLQHKKKISQSQNLVGPLFSLLNSMISLRRGNDVVEYGTQLVLGALINIFRISKAKLAEKDELEIELLVKCIQTSSNTQTCQHALMLLAESATICPEKLLHSVMSVFTFMGSTLLRRDDSYSFQVITRTIHTVVPALMKHMVGGEGSQGPQQHNKNATMVINIIRVFVDALPHIPTHRRLVVFEELINTLGCTEYLWQTLLLLVASRANKITKTTQDDDQEDIFLPSTVDALMEVCSSISNLYPDHLQLDSIVKMINYISLLPDENGKEQKLNPKKPARHLNTPSLVEVSKQSTSQLRRLHLAVVSFASHILSQDGSIAHSFKLEKSSEKMAVETAAKMILLECSLSYLSQTTTSVSEPQDDETSSRYYKTLQNRLNGLLDKINNLLPSGTFMLVVSNILHARTPPTTIHKVIELFNHRVAHSNHALPIDQEVLLHVCRQLILLCEATSDGGSGLRATAYAGLRHVARMCGITCASHLTPILPMICDLMNEHQPPPQLISAAMLCLSELFNTLKAHCISHLPRLAPCLIQLLGQSQVEKNNHMTMCILSAYQKLVDSLAHFISPYLVDFIVQVTCKFMILASACSSDHVAGRIVTILRLIGGNSPARVLVPAFAKSFEKISSSKPHHICVLLRMVGHHVATMTKQDLSHFSLQLFDFYLTAMEYRGKMGEVRVLESVEDISVDGVIDLLIKLPEATFKPLFVKLNHWGCSGDSPLTQSSTFYHCTSVMAARLKGLFCLFAGPLLGHMMESLKREETSDEGEYKRYHPIPPCCFISLFIYADNLTRCRYIVATFKLTLLHSTSNFMTQQRFDQTAGVLVDQLEKPIELAEVQRDYVINYVVPCIGQLVMSSRNDVAWQPLNYQILLKMRHKRAEVRLFALEALLVVTEKLGDDYMMLLPETIPFLAELMEDENDEVEKRCHSVIKKMEETLGEPLQKYF
uniref:HEAT repeat-containing protein 1 n=1 Tax=Ciona savignyi TaxID=51511 RepID=H2Y6G5_CIOSA